ncbi:hypothetical protein HS7_15020 [Sulfolobales archaeon HS-7]|nr:hypothetical protein HS7_15020 [Sulfolobales archaeon HS-7]
MKVFVDGEETGEKKSGCALCRATWGGYYEKIEDREFFFCCDICAAEFRNMVNEVKKREGWSKIDELRIAGDYYSGRNCVAINNTEHVKFFVKFGDEGKIERFEITG